MIIISKVKHPIIKPLPILNIDYETGIDTCYLMCKLSPKDKEFIYERYYNVYQRTAGYRHSLFLNDIGFTMHLSPIDPKFHCHFNATLKIHRLFFTSAIPIEIIEILNHIDWRIIRLDIFYDFKTRVLDSLLFKHHKTLFDSGKLYENETFYVGNYNSKRRGHILAHYDRQIKEQKRDTGIVHQFPNRMETRFKFTLKEMPIHNIQHGVILKQMKRYLFISDIEQLNTDKWRRNRIRKLQYNFGLFSTYPEKEQKKIRELLKLEREPLEVMYAANAHELFNFMDYDKKAASSANGLVPPVDLLELETFEEFDYEEFNEKEGGTMDKQQQNLLTKIANILQDPLQTPLIDFEELCGTYSRKKVNALNDQLDILRDEKYINFSREEYGFRIELLPTAI
ncbi:hypothetical protein FQ087_22095 [Sporosarcina sp. ANT_H38]|uniref:hypothetical protein n=2 Tax=unclassified Sporosarcina TaxID=2647733 RepID=UPI0011F3E960|nr:hypothetical protein [Sporosarcina sp. ANT_H38]KAA0940153.1 hypothetical protein FQ087_22095 [Sporosarcina sp. ANT_H38]QJS06539.1 hypothetical protein [Sporosarcina sp.]